MSRLSSSKYNFIRAKQLEAQDDGIALMPFTDSPVLDEVALPKKLQDFLLEHQQKEQKQDD